MTLIGTKEAYGIFLESEWWKALSLECRQRAGFVCGKCGKAAGRSGTQAHHLRYPEHWFDTRLEDLVCVCRECHEKEHGIVVKVEVKVRVEVVRRPEVAVKAAAMKRTQQWTLRSLREARSRGEITRNQFLSIARQNAWTKKTQMAKQKSRAKMRARRLRSYPLRERRWWPGIYEGVQRGNKPPGVS